MTISSAKPKVLLTGASSFVGAHACRFLTPHCQLMGVYFQTPIHLTGVQPVQLDLTSSAQVQQLRKQSIDVIVHTAGKIKSEQGGLSAYESNRRMMCNLLSLEKPIIYASSTAVHWDTDISYVRARKEDEQDLQASGLPYLILRPCAPYGPPLRDHAPKHKESFQTLVDIVRYAPAIPILGNGRYLRQPIHVDDFSALILQGIQNGCDNIALDAAGATAYEFRQIIRILQGSLYRRQPLLYVPKRLALLGARLFPNLEASLVSVMDTSEAFDVSPLHDRIALRSFSEGHLDLLKA